MASGASDGSVVIDTALDNTGFEKDSKKMQQSIKGVTQSINRAGQASASSMQPLFSAFEQVGKTIDSTAQRVQTFDSKLSGSVSSSDFGRNMSSAERSCASLEKQMQRLSESERMGIKTGSQMTRFQINVEKARDGANQLEQELQKLGAQKVTTPEYESLTASVQKAEQALFRLYDRRDAMSDMGVSESSREWQRLAVQIKNAEYLLESYEQSMQSMQANGTAYTSGADSAKYQETEATLARMTQQLSHYEQMAAQFDTVSGPASQSESALKNVDKELQQKPVDAGKASSALTAFGNTLKKAASSALRVTGVLAKISFKALAKGAKAATASIGKFFDRSERGTLTSKGLVKSLTSLKRMMISRVKEKLITTLMKGLSESMTALAQYSSAFNDSMSGMQNAAAGLSGNLAVMFGGLVNAIAPAISAIINWVATAISYLNALFALLSGGSSVTVAKKQTDAYAKSLGGAGGAAKELKEEVFGFDELNKESSDSEGGGGGGGTTDDLYEDVPIESLLPENIQNFFASIKEAFEAGDWEGIGATVGKGLNVVVSAVDSWIVSIQPLAVTWASRVARILNGLVSGVDWANLGLLVSDGVNLVFSTLNTFLDTFDWNALGIGIGKGLNSIFANTDWATIGATFANKWNTLINTIHGLVTTVDWAAFGSSVASGVKSWFSTINWVGIVSSFNAGIRGIFNSITTFMQSIDWASVGRSIGNLISRLDIAGMISSITKSLNTFVNSAFSLAMNILHSVDWRSLGAQFAGIVNGIDIATWIADWTALITTFVADALTLAAGFIESIDWTELGNALWNSVTGYFASYNWNGIISSAFELLGAAIGGATSLIASLASNIWNAIQQAWEGVKAYFGSYFDQYGGDIIAGLLGGIWNAISGIGQWIMDNIFTPFINGFKAAFGIASPSTVMQEQGGYIIEGLLQGITTAWESIIEWVTGAVEAFTEFFSGLWETLSSAASTAWDGISTTITDAWDGLVTTASTVWNGISTTITDVWNGLATAASEVWNGISTTITNAWNGLATATSEAWNGISTTISGVWDGISTTASNTWNGISTTISGVWDELTTTASNAWNGISTTISGVWDELTTTASNAWNGISTTISGVWDGLSSAATNTWNSINTTISGVWDGLSSAATNTWNGISTTISGVWDGLSSAATNTWNGISTTVSGVWDGLSSAATNTWNGISTTISGAWDGLSSAATNTWNSISTTISGVWDGLTTAASNTWNSISTTISGAWDSISTKATTVWSETTQYLSDTWDSVKSTADSAWKNVKDTVISWFTGTRDEAEAVDWSSVGEGITTGTEGGITGLWSGFKTRVVNKFTSLVSSVKSTLGIASPSKVFKSIGGFMMEGLNDGVESEEDTVFRTMGNLARSIADSVIDSPDIELTSDAVVSGIDRVADRLSSIAVTFTQIASMLNAVGGFYMPAVAAGTAIPYKARVAAETPSTGKSDPVTAFSTNFDETMSDQRDLLLEIIDILRKLKIVIDGDSLTKVLTSLQRAQERSYGYGGV